MKPYIKLFLSFFFLILFSVYVNALTTLFYDSFSLGGNQSFNCINYSGTYDNEFSLVSNETFSVSDALLQCGTDAGYYKIDEKLKISGKGRKRESPNYYEDDLILTFITNTTINDSSHISFWCYYSDTIAQESNELKRYLWLGNSTNNYVIGIQITGGNGYWSRTPSSIYSCTLPSQYYCGYSSYNYSLLSNSFLVENCNIRDTNGIDRLTMFSAVSDVTYSMGMDNITISYLTDGTYYNSIPEIIPDFESTYCINTSDYYTDFYFNMTDDESNSIYYAYSFDDWHTSEIIVDDFEEPDYSMISNGWSFNSTGCNYSTSDNQLELYKGCDEIAMVKFLASDNLNTSTNIMFDTWVFYNTSNTYEIWNWNNEKILGIKLESLYNSYNELITNFSYWNGSNYVFFNTSYYFGLFSVQFKMNDSNVDICINGLDEPSYNDCNYQVIENLHGTTNQIPGKFYITPTFNFNWNNEIPYILLDNIRYQENYFMDWFSYDGDGNTYIEKLITTPRELDLYLFSTDNVNIPDYHTYHYMIYFYGFCQNEIQYNETEAQISTITDGTRNYISSIPNGPTLFNNIFWFFLFIFLLIMCFRIGVQFGFILTGLVFGFVAYFLTGDLTQIVTSFIIAAMGFASVIMGLL